MPGFPLPPLRALSISCGRAGRVWGEWDACAHPRGPSLSPRTHEVCVCQEVQKHRLCLLPHGCYKHLDQHCSESPGSVGRYRSREQEARRSTSHSPPKRLKLPVFDVMLSTYEDENSPCQEAPDARSSRSMESDGSAPPSPSWEEKTNMYTRATPASELQFAGAHLCKHRKVVRRAMKDDVNRVLVAADRGASNGRHRASATVRAEQSLAVNPSAPTRLLFEAKRGKFTRYTRQCN